MKKSLPIYLLLAAITLSGVALLPDSTADADDWGFFGHRRINRLAIFTLPPEMMVFYKKHIEYLTEHSVDPDKRRYATKHEAPRHYIDIDMWGTYPFENVPRDWTDALMQYTDLYLVQGLRDTIHLFGNAQMTIDREFVRSQSGIIVERRAYRNFFTRNVLNQYYEDEWLVSCDSLRALLGYDTPCLTVLAIDRFSEHGILPYHLLKMQRDLTEAFRRKNMDRILRLSAEMGHYIGDAHVPLHTTVNYNGQLTDQIGIHALWESRLPELFADAQYDFFVGKAEYIENPRDYFWNIVLESHQLLDSVLLIEKDLSRTFPTDRQYCYEERLGRTIRTYCEAYAAAYHARMQGMVEQRMRDAIHATASSWYTAWVDAGQPNMRALASPGQAPLTDEEAAAIEAAFQKGSTKGREHEQ
ncbi:MAG TPA: zinc dependent phospholipase C family protein [Saprospiraceae bacterium]|nr:zinc dependent phospholipase C family protein [Saprospiraceae bacterium]HMP23185.1 zinc dependent phospholipase C family protein [Saprospiraceae bacterium]